MRPVDLLEQIHHELRTGGNTSFNIRGLAIDLTYSKGVSQAVPSHSDCHGTTRIMSKRGPTSGKDALGVSLLAGLLATVDEVIEGIVRCPSVALFGHGAKSELSPECAPKRTSADHFEFGFRP